VWWGQKEAVLKSGRRRWKEVVLKSVV